MYLPIFHMSCFKKSLQGTGILRYRIFDVCFFKEKRKSLFRKTTPFPGKIHKNIQPVIEFDIKILFFYNLPIPKDSYIIIFDHF